MQMEAVGEAFGWQNVVNRRVIVVKQVQAADVEKMQMKLAENVWRQHLACSKNRRAYFREWSVFRMEFAY